MFKLASDALDSLNSFPAVIPDFDSRKLKRLFPVESADSFAGPAECCGNPRIVVIIHCHYSSVMECFPPYLSRIPDYDLIVTITSPDLEDFVSAWAASLKPNTNKPRYLSIRYSPNHGRDVRPFWETGLEIASQYTVFLKLHTKSSPQYKDNVGQLWLKNILQNLLVDSLTVQQTSTIIHSGEYGAVFPIPWKPFRYWGWTHKENFYHSQDICKALSINPIILFAPLQYPVGNMYWGSTSIFRLYAEKVLSTLSWPEEPLPYDGTLLHSLERMTGYLYTAERKKIAFSGSAKSSSRGQGIFSWHIQDLTDDSCQSLRPAVKDEYTYLPDGQFSPAASLACFISGINSCMVPSPSMFPKSKRLKLVNKLISLPLFFRRIISLFTRTDAIG